MRIGLQGRRRALDVGTVNCERFGVMAGTGFDAVMIRNADADLNDRAGRFAYVAAGIRGAGRDPAQARVAIDAMAWRQVGATLPDSLAYLKTASLRLMSLSACIIPNDLRLTLATLQRCVN